MSKGGPRLQCSHCKDIIQSFYTHDFKYCKCGKIFVDGGTDYCRYGGNFGDVLIERDGKFVIPCDNRPLGFLDV